MSPAAATPRAVTVEADGGSRGNPGEAAYGAVLKDADTGTVIAERGERIGVATNNVAEYRGLIAGLELYREHADGAALEVFMDSKLVVEQMAGRWKVKHPDMRSLALRARRLAPVGTTYTWIPRARNAHADRLVNQALDAPAPTRARAEPRASDPAGDPARGSGPHRETDGARDAAAPAPLPRPPWEQGPPTTLVLLRHGQTTHTRERRFSGRGGSDPGLDEEGRDQVRATADWLAPLADGVDAILSSPLRRTRESAEIVAAQLGRGFDLEEGLAESSFGTWDGLTYAEVAERERGRLERWLASHDLPAGGHGDSLTGMQQRVGSTLDRLLAAHPGRTVLAVSHVTPIKLLLARALDLSLAATYRLEVAPASVTVVAWYPDGHPVVRLLNARPTGPGLAWQG